MPTGGHAKRRGQAANFETGHVYGVTGRSLLLFALEPDEPESVR